VEALFGKFSPPENETGEGGKTKNKKETNPNLKKKHFT
jgi:hypothetical protein